MIDVHFPAGRITSSTVVKSECTCGSWSTETESALDFKLWGKFNRNSSKYGPDVNLTRTVAVYRASGCLRK